MSTIARASRVPVGLAIARGLDCAFHATEVEELDEALAAIETAKANYASDREIRAFVSSTAG